jgi:hypothetical protein
VSIELATVDDVVSATLSKVINEATRTPPTSELSTIAMTISTRVNPTSAPRSARARAARVVRRAARGSAGAELREVSSM